MVTLTLEIFVVLAFMFILWPVWWPVLGGVMLGFAQIKSPPDTLDGKARPISAWISLMMMLYCWPFTLLRRKKFARHNNPDDNTNPSWLSQS